MNKNCFRTLFASGMLATNSALLLGQTATPHTVTPASLPRIGTINERFQSYNIEMVEVTGGRFWKPYDSMQGNEPPSSNQPTGVSPSLFEYRRPIDLYNARLRKLAAALGPAYLRVSGTWANTTYFQNSDANAPENPPEGFKSVLTRKEWKGVIDFSNAVDALIVTSFAVSSGVRDSSSNWTPDQARKILDFTRANHGVIAAAEFMNEPTMPEMGGGPKGYNAAAYVKDLGVFHAFIKQADPNIIVLGPGSVGEESGFLPPTQEVMKAQQIFAAGAARYFDAFSYHTYAAVSSRCASMGSNVNTTLQAALSDDWLSRGGKSVEYYAALRDRFMPGKPLWDTETAQAACGGDRWASTFADTFRYLNQLGDSARRGVQVQLYNTLAASDYGLLQQYTYEPRPNYWAALLWRKLMGTTVLDADASPATSLHLYAHCLRNSPRGVALLAINASETDSQTLNIPSRSMRYTFSANELTSKVTQLNGVELKLGTGDSLPELKGQPIAPGAITFAPKTITFLALPDAGNSACNR